jgi:aldose 1-epimerase
MMRSFVFCLAALLMFSTEACRAPGKAGRSTMTKTVFGKLPDGREVFQYTFANRSGVTMQIIDYGATLTSLRVPDRNGKTDDVVLGYDSLQGYMEGTAYFGAIVGRYGNRIGKGQFQLDGKRYQLTINDGENHLHGGKLGFNKVLWSAEIRNDSEEPYLHLRYVSRDGEEGYPGKVTLNVSYTLTDKNELRIDYEGTTDQPTILNPTHHSYFNLSGSFTNTILGHLLTIEADAMTPVDRGLIPTGQIVSVANTPMDFRSAMAIGSHIDDPDEQLEFGRGYDHNWVLRSGTARIRKAAELYEPKSGRLMTVFTNQPGLQFYSGNFLDGTAIGKGGIAYQRRTGLCLEAQAFPDSPNKPQFPSVILRPGQLYRQTTIYQFSTR